MRLMWRSGDDFGFVKGRCKATNLCPYCRILGVVETAEMLYLDALEHAPTLLLTLTAREHLTRPDTYDHLRQVRKAVRRLWPGCEWFVQVEFQKRGALHLHLLVKGVPVSDAEKLREAVCAVWCARVDAEPPGQDCRPINAAQAVVKYLQKELVHGLKREQAPPIGWRGHRTSQTRGYLVRPAAVMREEAKRSLRQKRALHAILEQLPDADAGLIEEVLDWKLERDAARSWTLAIVHHGTAWERTEDGMQPLSGTAAAVFSESIGAGPGSMGPSNSPSALTKATAARPTGHHQRGSGAMARSLRARAPGARAGNRTSRPTRRTPAQLEAGLEPAHSPPRPGWSSAACE
jgi:hypothetical protein